MDWLNYHHLRYFWVVAHAGSLRRAAEQLRVSAPSISTQLSALQEALGEPLFRREGRRLALTDYGRRVLGYADDIFALGRELLASRLGGGSGLRPRRLAVGVVDSLPKLAAYELLRPALQSVSDLTLAAEEGSLPELLGRLLAHQVDVILADEPSGQHPGARTFDHLLAATGTTFHAAPALAKKLRGAFPRNLDGAPALLPSFGSPLRRELEEWFRRRSIRPRVVAEFADSAMAKVAAADGLGVLALPDVLSLESVSQYRFVTVGRSRSCRASVYAITAQRRVEHPGVVALLAARARSKDES
ncbi:MAG: LysR family transcriptional regulator [Verrucomicrobia bacterium]|nr:LysR family transcriptional regulator [Verrucomicrobiota bacterium]